MRCSSKYRRYNDHVLPFLHNRPHDVVQHIMCRYADGKQLPSGSVVQKADGIFEVQSASSSGVQYTLLFDNEGMPRCDCFDWRRYHLPCKHFCAVFHLFPGYGWDALPASYRNSPFFTVDETVVGSHVDYQPLELASPPETTRGDTTDVICQEDNVSEADGHRMLNAKASACRELLHAITNSTYLVENRDALDALHNSLLKSHEALTSCIPAETGVHLHARRRQRTQKRSTTRKRYRQTSVRGNAKVARCADLPLRTHSTGLRLYVALISLLHHISVHNCTLLTVLPGQ